MLARRVDRACIVTGVIIEAFTPDYSDPNDAPESDREEHSRSSGRGPPLLFRAPVISLLRSAQERISPDRSASIRANLVGGVRRYFAQPRNPRQYA